MIFYEAEGAAIASAKAHEVFGSEAYLKTLTKILKLKTTTKHAESKSVLSCETFDFGRIRKVSVVAESESVSATFRQVSVSEGFSQLN